MFFTFPEMRVPVSRARRAQTIWPASPREISGLRVTRSPVLVGADASPQFGLAFIGPDALARFGGLVHLWLRSA